MTARRIVGGFASDAQAQVAASHLAAAENRSIERMDTQADLSKIYPSPANPRRITLDLAGVTMEKVQELAFRPKEALEVWRSRQELFLKELMDRDQIDAHGVWSELFSLAGSIHTSGLMQPIVAQPNGEIIAGERRWTAALLAGKRHERVIFRVAPEDQVHLMRLIENLHRSNLNVAEIASAVRRVVIASGIISGELSHENREISVDRMMSIFGCGRTQATYYRALCSLPNGDPLLERIISGAYTSLRTAYEDASQRLRDLAAPAVPPSANASDSSQTAPPPSKTTRPSGGVAHVKMPLPGTQGGTRILQALSSIEDLPQEAADVLESTMRGWTAAHDKARKQMLAKALENVIAALASLDDVTDDGASE